MLNFKSGLSLALLEAGILFVDHKQFALATNDLAIGTAFLNRCSYFHFFKLLAIGFTPLADPVDLFFHS